ncbi:MAG TPA: choice-of-anchor D domain-containing protein [Microthrixaceae bacterium]|nr:choice-of-anchor D domain-containing protein [Microthrixaceae bacterium]HMV68290.1 choice-of-anchor D domain-containing protein [Myxococcota bacterium]
MRSWLLGVIIGTGLAACTPDFTVIDKPDPATEPEDSDAPAVEEAPQGAGQLVIDPPSWDFGKRDEGDGADATFTLTNTGSEPVDVTGVALDGDAAFTSDAVGTSFTLAPGESAPVVVTYTAPPDPANGDLVVTSNDPAAAELHQPLTGYGRVRSVSLPDLDFGYVLLDTTTNLQLPITNDGNSPITIDAITSSDPHFPASLAGPVTIRQGESLMVDVGFSPEQVATYTSKLSVTSDATHRLPAGTASGQGATGPVAVCWSDPPTVAAIHETFELIGWDSYDLMGRPLTASWRWVSKPRGSAAPALNRQLNQGPLTVDVVGDYVAELVVTNDLGMVSAPCQTTVHAIADMDLWVEMFWEHAEDMDLHLARGTADLFSAGDCYYQNCLNGLEWGQAGDLDNPSLDLDDTTGTGPENINIARPAANTFRVAIHDHPFRKYQGANDVTINVYLFGQFEYTDTRTLVGEDDVVEVVEIDWTVSPPALRRL